jgi:hypothetical protein
MKQAAEPPMTLGNAPPRRPETYCLRPKPVVPTRRPDRRIEVSEETEVPSFTKKVVCAKCGARGRHIDVRPIWKEQTPPSEVDWEGVAQRGNPGPIISAEPIVRSRAKVRWRSHAPARSSDRTLPG